MSVELIQQLAKDIGGKMKIYLGGTCNESSWRDVIIPMLEIDYVCPLESSTLPLTGALMSTRDKTYFNPVVDDWDEESQKRELEARENCDFLLYFITPKMTGVYAVAEAVDDSNKRPWKTIFGYLRRDEDKEFTEGQLRSLRAVGRLIENNGGMWCDSLRDIAFNVNYLSWRKQ